jgi:hypothetical protein
MRAKFIYEKFTEDSDAVHDMGIGYPEIIELEKNYKKLKSYMKFEVEDLYFDEVVRVLDDLKKINYYTVTYYFNNKYGLKIKNEEHINEYDPTFAKAQIGKYKAYFNKSLSGYSIFIDFYDSWGVAGETTKCRSIHTLEKSFLKVCKELDIQLKTK